MWSIITAGGGKEIILLLSQVNVIHLFAAQSA